MTEHTQVTPNTGHDEAPAAELTPATDDQNPSTQTVPADGAARLMIPVAQLAAHPGNVRSDLNLTPEFCASVADAGVRVSLLITNTPDGAYRVIEGHRRLAAALKAGLAEVPCELDPARADDEAGQYLDMLLANGGDYRRNFTPIEEAAALFAAHEAGATRTQLRKSTGRKAEEIKKALRAGSLSAETRGAAGQLASQLTLDQLALLAEFQDDPDALQQVMTSIRHGSDGQYAAQRIRQDRADAAGHQQLRAELEAAGVTVTDGLPEGAVQLGGLLHDGTDLTPEAHADCPGRGAYFMSWDRLHPVPYCASPAGHGHTIRDLLRQTSGTAAAGTTAPGAQPGPPADGPADPARKLVIEGNKAWKAASDVRKRWLTTELFTRRTAPREAAQFITRQLLSMPDPLRSGLAPAPGRLLFNEITGHYATRWLETCDTVPAGRLPLLMLGPILTAYEAAMTEGEGRNTWRTDRYSPCPRREAGAYLAFLASIGHQLSPIEQALVNETPYTGDTAPAEPVSANPGPEGTDCDSVPGSDDAAADADVPSPGDALNAA
ncbi:MAG: ParB/RepB/Spo0J family partition protein [Streptosporangiaceae bacterium]